MERISLNGIWSFGTEYSKLNDKIEVPGGWKLYEKYEEYNGYAFYEHSFLLTEEHLQKQIAVCFGGVFRYADVYINGGFVMHHEGYQSAFEADINSFAKIGENRITVAVDNVRKCYDMMDGSTVWGMEPMRFAGIYEPVWIELREKLRVSDVYAALTPELDKIQAEIEIENKTVCNQDVKIEVEICGTDKKKTVIRTLPQGKDKLTVEFDSLGIKFWSPESPELYNVRVKIGEDEFVQRTGFKYFTVKDKSFYLNGQPYFLRGYGDDFVFPMTAHPSATDRTYYYKGLNRAKEYGFNSARHHSHFPFSTFFEAADEIGMLIQPELAMANIPIDRFTKKCADFFISEWRAIIKEHRHHPSVMAWCGGNEEEWGFFFEDRLCETAKELDPYRLSVPTDGRWMADEVENDSNYPYVSVCYAESTDVLPIDEYSDLYMRDDCGKPQIVHEMGNFTTLVPINDLPKYESAKNFPFKWQKWMDNAKKTNRIYLYDKAFANALEMQKLCYKLIIEKSRLSDAIRGYHIWTLTDFYETTQGILNQFYEDKAFTADEFSLLNAPSILLWNTERWCFGSGEKVVFEIDISRFDNDDWYQSKLTLTLYDGENTFQNELFVDASGYGTIKLTDWEVIMPEAKKGRKFSLNARLENGDKILSNSWDLWVYPSCNVADNQTGREIFIHYLSRYLVEKNSREVRHFTIPMPINGNLLVTEYLMDGMLDEVYNGARMLLLARPDTFKNTVNRNSFKPCWWSQQEYFFVSRSNNTQTSNVIADHAALDDIPHKSNWELNWYHLVEQRHAIELDSLPFFVTPIVFGIGPQLEKRGYLFEFAYGKGSVLVSTLNFDKTNLKHPEVRYVFESLLNYCDSDAFSPEHKVTPEQLENALNH